MQMSRLSKELDLQFKAFKEIVEAKSERISAIVGGTLVERRLELICPLQSGPKVNLDWTPKETNNGQEARA